MKLRDRAKKYGVNLPTQLGFPTFRETSAFLDSVVVKAQEEINTVTPNEIVGRSKPGKLNQFVEVISAMERAAPYELGTSIEIIQVIKELCQFDEVVVGNTLDDIDPNIPDFIHLGIYSPPLAAYT